MGLLDLLKKKDKDNKAEPAEASRGRNALAEYTNMRVEVTTFQGMLLFVATLRNLKDDTGELYQYSTSDVSNESVEETEPLRVRIRGYYEKARKAVYMEGTITPLPSHVWKAEELVVTGTGNERAFFRLDTNIEATATTIMGPGAGDYPCRLLNISVGGARIASDRVYESGEKFLLKVRLLKDRDISAMFCQVVRIIDKGDRGFEYGCRFLELNEADQDRITENIFAIQRKQRGAY